MLPNFHTTVLLHEAINSLDIKPREVFVDGTLGGGGHSEEVCKQFGENIRLIGIDQDEDALLRSKDRLSSCNPRLILGNFRDIGELLQKEGVSGADKILLDIGLSSNQFEESGRGFSFQKDEPLLMTFKKNPGPEDLTAEEILNTWDEENIQAILWGYGEERFAGKIARKIVEEREKQPIKTTFQLVAIVKAATPFFYHHRKIHPATKTFQALRITVNDEIESLKKGLQEAFHLLHPNGRLAVISFHSLEDRTVKQFFRDREDEGVGKRVTKKPITPGDEEVEENPRSRSAKLRVIQKL